MKKGNVKALLPIGVFLVLYLGLGIMFEYVLKIPMGFYNIPIVVAFLVALLVACLQNRKLNLNYTVTAADGSRKEVTETLYFRNRTRDGVNEWQDENPENYN